MNKLSIKARILLVSLPIILLHNIGIRSQVIVNQPLTFSLNGWTLNAMPAEGTLTLEHEELGVLLREIQLNVRSTQGLIPFGSWDLRKTGNQKLEIRTAQPYSSWIFDLRVNNLVISCTSSDMFLTAKAPASSDRIVARLIDPRGIPVDWTGTTEIKVSWKGNDTWNQSFLPVRNPEVMTFGLGQISALNLHSLFDRKKDIAIDFSGLTILQRDPGNHGLLNVCVPVPGNTVVRIIPDYYTRILGLPIYSQFDNKMFPSAPLVWGSWTAYYNEAKESDIVRNTDWLASNLKPYGFQFVQIDDGYDRGKPEGHYWIENWSRTLFPHGPEWLAGYIKSKGLRPGLWLVPNSYGGAYNENPDWYLHDNSGNPILDYSTPALDHTNPAVQEWLKKLFTTLKGWGFEYYKFDGEFSLPKYAPSVDKSRLYDKAVDPVIAYRNRLKLIRDIVGPETFIEGCVAGTPLNGIGYFNSVFNGADMYNSFKGCYAVFSSINANAFLNNIVIYVMPGEGIDVSPVMSVEEANRKMVPRALQVVKSREDPFTGFGSTLAEARTMVSIVSLTGVVYPLTSIMPELPDERIRLLKMTMPTMPVFPVDLYSRGTDITWDKFKYTTPDEYIHNYPEIINLKVNALSGIYDVVALTNWRSEKLRKNISFADKLGLKDGVSYVLFDFWNQKLLGVFRDQAIIDIEPHDTRVIFIHSLQDKPQLIGNSRHISGAYSIMSVEWDNTGNRLSGSSETVAGDDYSLYFYVPSVLTVSRAEASAGSRGIKVNSELTGNLLRLSFPGQPEPVKWQVTFTGNRKK